MKPEHIVAWILADKGTALDLLPEEQGLYALRDHEGRVRYIGITAMTIRRRVYQYHVAGDGNSHKYSSAYNAGMLWHDRKNIYSDLDDGTIAKRARRDFARLQCTATAIELPGLSKQELEEIERQVIRLFPNGLDWNNRRDIDTINVDHLVDDLFDHWNDDERRALFRQSRAWRKEISGRNTS